MLCVSLTRFKTWFVGLIIYGVANGVYAVALIFGPLSVLGGIFTTLLVWNMLFARLILHETLETPRVIGALVILVGVTCTAISTPSDIETEFGPADLEELFHRPASVAFISGLIVATLICVMLIIVYERKYPQGPNHPKPPPALDEAMGVLYPMSLGMDEGIALTMMRSCVTSFNHCSNKTELADCNHWTVFLTTSVWIMASLATLWWLRVVFRRYETTQALPIEYGTVNVIVVASGLIFFDEARYFNRWQLPLIIIGASIIVVGIGVSRLRFGSSVAPSTKTHVKPINKADGAAAISPSSLSPYCVSPEPGQDKEDFHGLSHEVVQTL